MSGFVRKSNGAIGVFLVMEVWKIGAVDGGTKNDVGILFAVFEIYILETNRHLVSMVIN